MEDTPTPRVRWTLAPQPFWLKPLSVSNKFLQQWTAQFEVFWLFLLLFVRDTMIPVVLPCVCTRSSSVCVGFPTLSRRNLFIQMEAWWLHGAIELKVSCRTQQFWTKPVSSMGRSSGSAVIARHQMSERKKCRTCDGRPRRGRSGFTTKLRKNNRLCGTSRLRVTRGWAQWPCNIGLRLNVTGDRKTWRRSWQTWKQS